MAQSSQPNSIVTPSPTGRSSEQHSVEPTAGRRIRKAVVPLAGRATRLYPASARVKKGLFPLVDRDGIAKPTIQIIIEEALLAGIEEICLVTAPGDEAVYRSCFQPMPAAARPAFAGRSWALELSDRLEWLGHRVTYAVQSTPDGYGHAIYCARDFVGNEPFLVMLGDHVYISRSDRCCAGQLLDVHHRFGATVSAVSLAMESELPYFGTIRGRLVAGEESVWEADEIVEKPDAAYARSHLRADGVADGRYLCYFGLHAMTPAIFDVLDEAISARRAGDGEVQFTAAQAALRDRERYLAYLVDGERHDTGIPGGLIETQLALALASPFRDAVVNQVRSAE